MSETERKLIIACGDQVIGEVSESNDTFSFMYDDAWIAQENSFDLSPRFKRITKVHTGIAVKNFLENLLPEEDNRRAIAEKNKLDAKDVVGLLMITGRDSAGALQIYSEEEFRELKYDPHKVQTIMVSHLAEGIKKSGTAINFITTIGLEPSLSGAQDKIACRYDRERNEVSFPVSGGATTHILKPNNVTNKKGYKILELSALNELISLRLAEKVLNNVPPTCFYESPARDLFIIERYDRQVSEVGIRRIHQFDFCQYFGLSSSDKYEVSPGRAKKGKHGVKDILSALQEESEEPTDVEKMLDWVVFNYLIGNTDSHLKNISMISTGSGFKLAPFYDITSVEFYQDKGAYLFDNNFAFDIGGESKMNQICDFHWKKFAKDLGLGEDYFLLRIRQLSYAISHGLKGVYDELKNEVKDPRNLKRAEKILKFLGSSMEVKSHRCLTNSKFKTAKTQCSVCGKPLSKQSVLDIDPECLKKFS